MTQAERITVLERRVAEQDVAIAALMSLVADAYRAEGLPVPPQFRPARPPLKVVP